MEKSKLKKIIESLIFSSTKPISLRELKNFFTDESISRGTEGRGINSGKASACNVTDICCGNNAD